MSNKMMKKVEGQELILERVFDAPRELVFKAFSEAEHLKRWWPPRLDAAGMQHRFSSGRRLALLNEVRR
ncbi:SRPBCC domain-containing protein [Gordoniibacillus kamchatkensis]|uniref:SRPBCC domain-containing protein n=1 Tax=Gordoniibacillus kamchatkensis TaxID=1590651 RepID=UPI000A6049BC|nr:SRPBCC domain-containing protein [Paenibacillus sp. VKM B-2647]